MLIIKVNKGNIEQSLKTLKRKIRNTKQYTKLRDLKCFDKPSAVKRRAKSKAIHVRKKFNSDS